jgi:hypothetical protein
MGVECVSIDPSFSDTFDGSASLYITGGTPPYLYQLNSYPPKISLSTSVTLTLSTSFDGGALY